MVVLLHIQEFKINLKTQLYHKVKSIMENNLRMFWIVLQTHFLLKPNQLTILILFQLIHLSIN